MNIRPYISKFILILFFSFLFVFNIKTAFAISTMTDDFTGSVIDTSKWTEFETAGSNVSQNNALTVLGSNAWNSNGVRTASTYDRATDNLTIETDMTFSNCADTNAGILYGPLSGLTGNIIFNRVSGGFALWSFPASVPVTGATCQNGVPIHVKIVIKTAGGVDVYLNGSSTPNGSLTAVQAPNTFNNHPVSLQQYSSTSTITYDNFKLNDPSSSWTVPGIPSTLLPEAGNEQIILSWSAPFDGGTPITDYVIEYKLTASGSWAVFNDGTSTTTTATVTGLTNGASYSFRVSAINSVGTGTASSTVIGIPFSPETIFSDDFTGTTFNSSLWTEVDSASGGSGPNAGNVRQNDALTVVGDGSNWANNGLTTVNTYDGNVTDLIIEADVKSTNCAVNQAIDGISYGNMDPLANPGDTYFVSQYNGFVSLWYFRNGGVNNFFVTDFACTNNTSYHIKFVILRGGGAKLYLDNSVTPDAIITGNAIENKHINLHSHSATTTSTFDNLVVSGGATDPVAPSAANVTITGSPSVGETIRGSYTFSDLNADSEGTSTYRWLRSDTPTGTYTAITGATAITYVVKIEDLSKYIKFEVTPVSTSDPTTGSPVLSSATSQVSSAISNYFYHILSTGQSLSIGLNGSPALTTSQPYNNKMLSGSSLVPLVESSVETMSSALANSVTSRIAGNAYDMIVTRHGVSSTAYTGLKKGTAPYEDGLDQVSDALSAVTSLSRPYKVTAVTVIHGESDHLAGTTKAQYEADLVEWQHDYETDVRVITGQADSIPLFTDQMSSWTGYSSATSVIPYAQLAAAENNPAKIILVGPKYFLNYSDTAHLTNTSYRWLGEYYAKVYKRVVVDREDWVPLSPGQIVRNGNIIYAQFNVPEQPIVLDTTNVDSKTNYGFEYTDNTSSASISSVEIINSNTVKVTLSSTPTGSNQKLRYAYTGTSGSNPGAHVSGSARGNLRDSDSTTSLYGNNLYNWAVHFDKPISDDTTIPTISNVSVSTGTTTGTVTWTTNETSSSIVDYGTTASYGTSTSESDILTGVSSHSVSLSGLQSCTTYHYRVRSKDLAQNEASSADSTFTTSCPSSNSNNDDNDDEDDKDNNQCSDQVGIQPPWLYGAIAQNSTSILLYFTEAAEPVDRYSIKYGLGPNDYIYGADNLGIKSESRMTYLVKELKPNTTYYFKVRGGNGCKPGDWSNEIKATTKSSFSYSNLEFTSSNLETIPLTQDDLDSSGINSTNDTTTTSESADKKAMEEIVDAEGYTVKVKVIDEQGNPVEGANVTMHSKVQEAVSDKDGYAIFNNVEKGDHRVIIAYNGFEGEQALNLTGDVKEFSLEIKIKPQNVFYSPIYLWSIGIFAVITTVLVILLIRRRK